MNNKVLINTGNRSSKVLITDNKIKYIEEPEQLKQNELKRQINSNNINNSKQ